MNVEESSGTSEVPTLSSSYHPETIELHQISDDYSMESTSIHHPETMELQQISDDSLEMEHEPSVEDITITEVLDETDSVELIEVDSKTSLQMELLRWQIEYTKRDILLLELKILEKERSLTITENEKSRLIHNCENRFKHRRNIE